MKYRVLYNTWYDTMHIRIYVRTVCRTDILGGTSYIISRPCQKRYRPLFGSFPSSLPASCVYHKYKKTSIYPTLACFDSALLAHVLHPQNTHRFTHLHCHVSNPFTADIVFFCLPILFVHAPTVGWWHSLIIDVLRCLQASASSKYPSIECNFLARPCPLSASFLMRTSHKQSFDNSTPAKVS